MSDARYEDAQFADRPLKIAAADADDLQVISTLVQDAVGLAADIAWMPRRRRFVMLLNRFRWEDREAATRDRRSFERVRAALVAEDVRRVRSQGLDPNDKDTVYSVLNLAFEPGEDGTGTIHVTLAGDGELVLEVETLDLKLSDLTRPWQARGAPDHGDP
ncbi:MAG: DUF2948 family protein [Pseudomonadota bacterium]